LKTASQSRVDGFYALETAKYKAPMATIAPMCCIAEVSTAPLALAVPAAVVVVAFAAGAAGSSSASTMPETAKSPVVIPARPLTVPSSVTNAEPTVLLAVNVVLSEAAVFPAGGVIAAFTLTEAAVIVITTSDAATPALAAIDAAHLDLKEASIVASADNAAKSTPSTTRLTTTFTGAGVAGAGVAAAGVAGAGVAAAGVAGAGVAPGADVGVDVDADVGADVGVDVDADVGAGVGDDFCAFARATKAARPRQVAKTRMAILIS